MCLKYLKGFKKAGYFKKLDSLNQVEAFLGKKPLLAKAGSKKIKTNPVTGKTKLKCRIIVNSKQAKSSKASKRTHKSNLPTATGSTIGFVGLIGNSSNDPVLAGLEFLVIDISDAVWLVPLIIRRDDTLSLSIVANSWSSYARLRAAEAPH